MHEILQDADIQDLPALTVFYDPLPTASSINNLTITTLSNEYTVFLKFSTNETELIPYKAESISLQNYKASARKKDNRITSFWVLAEKTVDIVNASMDTETSSSSSSQQQQKRQYIVGKFAFLPVHNSEWLSRLAAFTTLYSEVSSATCGYSVQCVRLVIEFLFYHARGINPTLSRSYTVFSNTQDKIQPNECDSIRTILNENSVLGIEWIKSLCDTFRRKSNASSGENAYLWDKQKKLRAIHFLTENNANDLLLNSLRNYAQGTFLLRPSSTHTGYICATYIQKSESESLHSETTSLIFTKRNISKYVLEHEHLATMLVFYARSEGNIEKYSSVPKTTIFTTQKSDLLSTIHHFTSTQLKDYSEIFPLKQSDKLRKRKREDEPMDIDTTTKINDQKEHANETPLALEFLYTIIEKGMSQQQESLPYRQLLIEENRFCKQFIKEQIEKDEMTLRKEENRLPFEGSVEEIYEIRKDNRKVLLQKNYKRTKDSSNEFHVIWKVKQ